MCIRDRPDAEEADSLKSENAALRENLQKLALRFTDGIAAFEVRGNLATPLYVSDNVLEFFGMKREDWLPPVSYTHLDVYKRQVLISASAF